MKNISDFIVKGKDSKDKSASTQFILMNIHKHVNKIVSEY